MAWAAITIATVAADGIAPTTTWGSWVIRSTNERQGTELQLLQCGYSESDLFLHLVLGAGHPAKGLEELLSSIPSFLLPISLQDCARAPKPHSSGSFSAFTT